jgi:hypothetical protein
MKIKNKTEWNTKDLMKLIRATAKKEGLGIKRHIIEIVYSKVPRQNHYSGLGRLGIARPNMDDAEYGNGRWVKMKVPHFMQTKSVCGSDGKWSSHQEEVPFKQVLFAQILTHEFGHNMGLLHKEMCKLDEIDCEWANEFHVRAGV